MEQLGSETQKGKRKGAGGAAIGRKDESKQPAVTKPEIVAKKLDYLVKLHNAAAQAGDESKEANAKVAEEAGYNAGTVAKLVRAKASDRFPEKKREVEQQAELFDEIDD